MSYLIPTQDEYVDLIAKTIAQERWRIDVGNEMRHMMGDAYNQFPAETIERTIADSFDALWGGSSPQSISERDRFREEAIAVIAALNLKFLTMPS